MQISKSCIQSQDRSGYLYLGILLFRSSSVGVHEFVTYICACVCACVMSCTDVILLWYKEGDTNHLRYGTVSLNWNNQPNALLQTATYCRSHNELDTKRAAMNIWTSHAISRTLPLGSLSHTGRDRNSKN